MRTLKSDILWVSCNATLSHQLTAVDFEPYCGKIAHRLSSTKMQRTWLSYRWGKDKKIRVASLRDFLNASSSTCTSAFRFCSSNFFFFFFLTRWWDWICKNVSKFTLFYSERKFLVFIAFEQLDFNQKIAVPLIEGFFLKR